MINLFLLFGAIQVSCSGDVAPALQGLADQCAAYDDESCMVELSPGICTLSHTIAMCPGFELSGASETFTTLVADSGVTAFHALRYGECRDAGKRWHGRVRIERMSLRGPYATDAPTFTAGLFLEHLFHVERLIISYFVQGIRFEADVRSVPASGANLASLDDVRIFNTFHSAFRSDGGDVNVMHADQLMVTSPVCTQATARWDAELNETCAGVSDDGFLGSVYTAPHVSGAGPEHRSFDMTNLNARHVLVGPYTEGGQMPGNVGVQSIAIGGLSYLEGKGLIIGPGRTVNGLRLVNDLDPLNVVELELGEQTNLGGTFLALRANAISTGWPLRIKAEPSQNAFRFDIGNLNIATPIRIIGNRNGPYELGTLRLRSALLEIEQ